jgi:hypothetical protein
MVRPLAVRTVLVDGNNVMGAAADGWWRDRPGAVRRLAARLRGYAACTGEAVVLALDVPQDDLPEGDADGIVVRYPHRRGRDAADDRIVELLAGDAGGPDDPTGGPGGASGPGTAEVVVVTSDRALRQRVAALGRPGTTVEGAGAFLGRLRDLGL